MKSSETDLLYKCFEQPSAAHPSEMETEVDGREVRCKLCSKAFKPLFLCHSICSLLCAKKHLDPRKFDGDLGAAGSIGDRLPGKSERMCMLCGSQRLGIRYLFKMSIGVLHEFMIGQCAEVICSRCKREELQGVEI